jgi:hypothetical protein
LYPKKAKIAVHYVYLVDDLPECYRIFVPELFPIVPELFPQGITYQTRKGDPLMEKKIYKFVQKGIGIFDFYSAMEKIALENNKITFTMSIFTEIHTYDSL